jgi:hypothetical protein
VKRREFLKKASQGSRVHRTDTSALGGLGERYFSHPYVVSHRGLRGGPVRSHLASIVDHSGAPTAPNLDLLGFAKVQRIVFDEVDRHRAVGITHAIEHQPLGWDMPPPDGTRGRPSGDIAGQGDAEHPRGRCFPPSGTAVGPSGGHHHGGGGEGQLHPEPTVRTRLLTAAFVRRRS